MPDAFAVPVRELLDPQVLALNALAASAGWPPADPLALPLAEARAAAERHHAFLNGRAPVPVVVQDVEAAGPGGPLRLRLIRPPGEASAHLPVLIYFHGGGFALNSIYTHDRLLRLLARHGRVAVCAVAYSLAPERRFPFQHEEALSALRWVVRHGPSHGLDRERLAVGGDSAGANLALGLALASRGEPGPPVSFGLLFYGMFAHDFDTASHRLYGAGGFGLTTERMRWYWRQYLGEHTPAADAWAAPLLADLRGLPPLYLAVAGLDCLRDDSLRLARRLEEAKVPHRVALYEDLPHAFAGMTRFVRRAEVAVIQAASAVGGHLRGQPLALANG
ncbi:alpha/beta hydrolase [Azospirillum picis]|uniref:Acetyl esterase n=1 Tax=Azospirillum picis TaxID=488438 RepID=A0ABU0MQE4_9PROT|nr:alpha/beta hydrolase [Azospirillum picis]MBP2302016.1 acetyl esterase [Azospirillum picis]MDQ0535693.1 acetyl esterase [Azospirillum picis]